MLEENFAFINMLRRIRGVALRDRQRSENIRRDLGLKSITRVIRISRLRWFGNVMKMEPENEVERTVDLEVEGRGPR